MHNKFHIIKRYPELDLSQSIITYHFKATDVWNLICNYPYIFNKLMHMHLYIVINKIIISSVIPIKTLIYHSPVRCATAELSAPSLR